MIITLGGKDSIFKQIKDQIIKFIEIGVLKVNDKLPSVRDLASELGVNPNTVMKAYVELENEGYVYTIAKKGAFIADLKITKDELLDFKNEVKILKETIDKEKLIKVIEEIYGGETC